ncbi:TetR/AcrR family transcriptional regulator [Microbacterium soli]|uniref:TetR/AcrR family transcriptional regulator n=1 Tax=Microbacterium soli TaxID=446075 RepID=A0ABP7MVR2_9MICO
MTTAPQHLRADAKRNRERLIAAAVEAFTSGREVSLDAIARRAGVGSGTLYRHFPTREDLVEEVYRDQVRPLREEAMSLLAEHEPPRALQLWMLAFAEWATQRRGVVDALVAMSASGRFGTGPVCDEVQHILQLLLDAGSAMGQFRADIAAIDVGGILAGLLSVAGAPEQRDQLDRMISIVVVGLRATESEPASR